MIRRIRGRPLLQKPVDALAVRLCVAALVGDYPDKPGTGFDPRTFELTRLAARSKVAGRRIVLCPSALAKRGHLNDAGEGSLQMGQLGNLRFAEGEADDGPEAWIARVAHDGDRGCFIALFDHYAPRIKSYLIQRGLAPTLSEDLAQETMLRVWRKARAFDPSRATPGAWIFTIARNLRIDTVRRELRPIDFRYQGEQAAQPSPEQNLKNQDDHELVRAAIDKLPAAQSQVLRLAFFEDKTHPEIALQLGLPLGTVKSRIRLASAALRAALHELV